MAVTVQDMEELAVRIAEKEGKDSEEWLESTSIELAAFSEVLHSAARQGVGKALADGDLYGAFIDIAGQSFRLGWQVRDELA